MLCRRPGTPCFEHAAEACLARPDVEDDLALDVAALSEHHVVEQARPRWIALIDGSDVLVLECGPAAVNASFSQR